MSASASDLHSRNPADLLPPLPIVSLDSPLPSQASPTPIMLSSSSATPQISATGGLTVDLGNTPGQITIPGTGLTVDIPTNVRDRLPEGTVLNVNPVQADDDTIGSIAIDLTLTDAPGRTIQFDGEIELCFDQSTQASKVRMTLSFRAFTFVC